MSNRDTILAELQSYAETQLVKYDYTLSGTIAVPNGQSRALILNVEQDADFLICEATMSCYGPTDANGIPLFDNAPLSLPKTSFPTLGSSGTLQVAQRGLTMAITDTGSGRLLTSGEIPVELIGTPAYGQQIYIPWKLRYLALRNSKLRFDLRNRDQAVDSGSAPVQQYHYFEIALHGYKYESYLTR